MPGGGAGLRGARPRPQALPAHRDLAGHTPPARSFRPTRKQIPAPGSRWRERVVIFLVQSCWSTPGAASSTPAARRPGTRGTARPSRRQPRSCGPGRSPAERVEGRRRDTERNINARETHPLVATCIEPDQDQGSSLPLRESGLREGGWTQGPCSAHQSPKARSTTNIKAKAFPGSDHLLHSLP